MIKKNLVQWKQLLPISLPLALFIPQSANAACPPGQYEMIIPLGALPACVTFVDYINGIFQIIIGVAGILAVIVLVVCGIRLMATPTPQGRSEAKNCIWKAILGVLLAISSWIILNTINPLLLINKTPLGPIASTTGSAVTPLTPSGTYSWEPSPACPNISGNITSVVADTFCSPPKPGGHICCRYVPIPSTPPPVIGLPLIPVTITPPSLPPPPSVPTTATVGPGLFSFNEYVGVVNFIIKKEGDDNAGSVEYRTVSGSATAGVDFVYSAGVLNFPIGVTSRTISVPITNDALIEGNETFVLELFNPVGMSLGTISSKTITINDEDKDKVAPVVTILSPHTNGLATTTATPIVVFKVIDALNIENVTITTRHYSESVAYASTTYCSGTCITPSFSATTTGLLDLTKYGNNFVTITACDKAGNCGKDEVYIEIQAPCVDKNWLKCFLLTQGIATPPPPAPVMCIPTDGKTQVMNATGEHSTSTHAYAFKLTKSTGGGRVVITGGEYEEYPVPARLDLQQCVFPPPPCPCTFWACPDLVACTIPRPPKTIIASISAVPRDISSTANTVWTPEKRVSGRCGTGSGLSSEASLYFTGVTGSGPTWCELELDRTYYLNIHVVTGFLSLPTREYSLFWHWHSTSSPFFVPDVVKPDAPIVMTPPGSTVFSSTIVLSGTASEPGTVSVYKTVGTTTLKGALLASAITTGALNDWSVTLNGYASSSIPYRFLIDVTDFAGNTGPTTLKEVIVSGPSSPVIIAPSAAALLSSSTPITVSGIGSKAGNNIYIFNSAGTLLKTTTVTPALTWSTTITFTPGVKTIYGVQYEPWLGISLPSANRSFTIF